MNRIDVVDYIKAVCSVFVILLHSGLIDEESPLTLLIFNMAVPIFMLLSGYMVGLRKVEKTFDKHFCRSFIKYSIPTVIAFSMYIVYQMLVGNSYTTIEIAKIFLFGRYGAGAYYFGLMIQFLLSAPLIVRLIRRWDVDGVILIGLLNFFWDVLCSSSQLDVQIYRIFIFRYFLLIALGVWLGCHPEKEVSRNMLAISLLSGAMYILLPVYWDYEYRIFTYDGWGKTSMMVSLWVFPILYIILCHFKDCNSSNIGGRAVAVIGKSSYHIMYTQMIYYVVRPYFDRIVFDISGFGGVPVELAVDMMVSLSAGVLFWYVDRKFLTGKIIQRIR